jgi:hypothetical protein
MSRGAFGQISTKLSALPETDLIWISELLDVALLRGQQPLAKSKRPVRRLLGKPTGATVPAKKKPR